MLGKRLRRLHIPDVMVEGDRMLGFPSGDTGSFDRLNRILRNRRIGLVEIGREDEHIEVVGTQKTLLWPEDL